MRWYFSLVAFGAYVISIFHRVNEYMSPHMDQVTKVRLSYQLIVKPSYNHNRVSKKAAGLFTALLFIVPIIVTCKIQRLCSKCADIFRLSPLELAYGLKSACHNDVMTQIFAMFDMGIVVSHHKLWGGFWVCVILLLNITFHSFSEHINVIYNIHVTRWVLISFLNCFRSFLTNVINQPVCHYFQL